jgi:hypothetical protein
MTLDSSHAARQVASTKADAHTRPETMADFPAAMSTCLCAMREANPPIALRPVMEGWDVLTKAQGSRRRLLRFRPKHLLLLNRLTTSIPRASQAPSPPHRSPNKQGMFQLYLVSHAQHCTICLKPGPVSLLISVLPESRTKTPQMMLRLSLYLS